MRFRLADTAVSTRLSRGSTSAVLGPVQLKAGPGRLEAWVDSAGKSVGVHYLHVRRIS